MVPTVPSSSVEAKVRRAIKETFALPLKQKLVKYKTDPLEAAETVKNFMFKCKFRRSLGAIHDRD